MEYLKSYGLSEKEIDIVSKAKGKFDQMVIESDGDYFGMANHLAQVEQWAQFALYHYPDINPYIFFLGVWLHDIGFMIKNDPDHHDSNGEKITKEFLLTQEVSEDIILQVTHCVRSHRRKDLMPQSLEAKMVACIDSASHFTDEKMYFVYAYTFGIDLLSAKIERDYNDTLDFSIIHEKILPYYQAWKQLLPLYKNFTF